MAIHDSSQATCYQRHEFRALASEIKGGNASLREIAQAFLAHDKSQIKYYEQIAKQLLMRVLSAHAIVEREGKHEAYHAMMHRLKHEDGVA